MTRKELIEKYKGRIKKLNKYIASEEKILELYNERYGIDSKQYISTHNYYMQLIVECNTCYDIVNDLEGGVFND